MSGLSVLAAAALLASCGTQAPPPEPPRPAIVGQPRPADAAAGTWYSGEIRARHESQLAFRIAGKIERRLVDLGARVEAGEVLAVLDPADLNLDLAAAQAAEGSARADAALARTEHDRLAALLDRQLISTSQVDAAETALAAAEARLEQARTQLAVARNQVGYAQLRADRAGVVTAIQAETGQVVAPGQTIAVLAQDGEREVEFALPESQLARYAIGARAEVSLWANPEHRHHGRIREISPDSEAGSRTYRARLKLDDSGETAQLGMTARVAFSGADGEAALSVPLTAIHGEPLSPAVWLLDPDSHQVRRQPVQVLRWRETDAEIGAGLAPGDWLVLVGAHRLHDGQTVRPIDADNRPIQFAQR